MLGDFPNETIRVSVTGGVASLRLARPAMLNALNRPMLSEIINVIDRVRDSPDIRVLMISGEGRAFSSGADLGVGGPSSGGAVDGGDVLEHFYNPLIERMFALDVPIVAAVHGAVAGAACMLALAADFVVAARSAFFLQAFSKVGLVPDAGSLWLLPRLIGRARATAMMMFAERIDAATALDWGMIYDVVEDDVLLDRAREIADRLSHGPTRSYAMIRQGIRFGMERTLSEVLMFERGAQRRATASADFLEGVAAFRDKRPPTFTGR